METPGRDSSEGKPTRTAGIVSDRRVEAARQHEDRDLNRISSLGRGCPDPFKLGESVLVIGLA
jgi:hypothetical protein